MGEAQMITYLKGSLRIKPLSDERITLIVNGIGYDILIPAYVMNRIKKEKSDGDELELYVSYNQTERQPKPVLVGFESDLDKEFFELFISVEDIGPTAAVKALIRPVREIARSIEGKDSKALKQLRGIGERKAEKIIATLKGKVAKYALMPELEAPAEVTEDFQKEVEDVLITQLGHKQIEARKMIEEAMKRNPRINSSEELFEEVYRGQKK
jgi:holliday junction DNA helicase RuvA